MFDLRVICPTSEVPFVVRDLCRAFTVRDVKQYPARTEGQERLYITAERHTEPVPVDH